MQHSSTLPPTGKMTPITKYIKVYGIWCLGCMLTLITSLLREKDGMTRCLQSFRFYNPVTRMGTCIGMMKQIHNFSTHTRDSLLTCVWAIRQDSAPVYMNRESIPSGGHR